MKKSRLVGVVSFYVLSFFFSPVNAATVAIYTDRTDFTNAVGNTIYDDFSALGYRSGDIHDLANGNDRHSDAHMTSVLGETSYTSTSYANANYTFPLGSDYGYCAGCNGSFLLDFSSTSLTGSSGVYGVGFGIVRSYISGSDTLATLLAEGNRNYTAYVTFGDGTTANLEPTQTYTVDSGGSLQDGYSFWGITSQQEITSIHIGLADGAVTYESNFTLGDLTIASSPVPIPPALYLFGSGLLGLVGVSRRKRLYQSLTSTRSQH